MDIMDIIHVLFSCVWLLRRLCPSCTVETLHPVVCIFCFTVIIIISKKTKPTIFYLFEVSRRASELLADFDLRTSRCSNFWNQWKIEVAGKQESTKLGLCFRGEVRWGQLWMNFEVITKTNWEQVTEQQLLGNTGPSKTLDVFLSFLGQSQVLLFLNWAYFVILLGNYIQPLFSSKLNLIISGSPWFPGICWWSWHIDRPNWQPYFCYSLYGRQGLLNTNNEYFLLLVSPGSGWMVFWDLSWYYIYNPGQQLLELLTLKWSNTLVWKFPWATSLESI